MENNCDNCKHSKIEPLNTRFYEGHLLYCNRLFTSVFSKTYVSKKGVCDKWKSKYPKGYRKVKEQ